MQLVSGSERIIAHANCDPVQATVRWAPIKSLWIGSMTTGALVLGPVYFSWTALLLFVVISGITLCAGHSVGMHRRLIHNSFECPLWLEYLCVYLGVLVGMAGPIGMIHSTTCAIGHSDNEHATVTSLMTPASGETAGTNFIVVLIWSVPPELARAASRE